MDERFVEDFWMGKRLSKMFAFADSHMKKGKWIVNQWMEGHMDLKWMEGVQKEVYVWIQIQKGYQYLESDIEE